MEMYLREADFASRLSEYQDVLYLCHRNADPDSVGSGFALQQSFSGHLGAVGALSRAGKRLAEVLEAEVLIDPPVEVYDLVVMVDASTWLQMGSQRPSRYAVVDHHLDGEILDGARFSLHRPADSTAQIVWNIIKASGKAPAKESCLGLLVGIIADTGRFKHCGPDTFRVVAELLEEGNLNYGEALGVLSSIPSDPSQRIALLKAANRAKIEWIGDWVVVSTEVGSFEGSAATALLELGADVAFAGGKHGKGYRVSARAGFHALQAGLDLALLMGEAAGSRGGKGGGHKGAAALEIPRSGEALLGELRRRALEILTGIDPGED